MVRREEIGINGIKLFLAAALAIGLVAVPALSWAGPKVILVGPRLRLKPAKIVAAPRAPRHYRVIKILPNGHKRVVVKGVPYYYHQGVFYRSGASGYVVVNAPLGFRIGALPSGYSKIRIGNRQYFYHDGNYFRWNPDLKVYVVVNAPQGAAVAYLPDGHSRVSVDGETYYKFNGAYYRQERINGRTMYVVTEI